MKKFLLFAVMTIMFAACENTNLDMVFSEHSANFESSSLHRINVSLLADIPFASMDELDRYTDSVGYIDNGVLDYRYARDKAFAELCANFKNYYPEEIITDLHLPSDMNDYTLLAFADRPVIVYDYEDKPYFYEFPLVYRGSTIVGTVTVAAQPFSKELIHYLFPDAIQYNTFSFLHKRYVGEYPCVYFSDNNTVFYKAELNENLEGELRLMSNFPQITDRYLLMKEKFNRLTHDQKDSIEHDLLNTDYLDNDDSHFPRIDNYIDSFYISPTIINYWRTDIANYDYDNCDTFAINSTIEAWININVNEIDASYRGFLTEYKNDRLRLTQWDGYCGPAIMAWLYRGKYTMYNGVYLPIYNDNYFSLPFPYDDLINFYTYLGYFMKPYTNEIGLYPTIVQTHSLDTDNGLFFDIFHYCDEVCGEYPLLDWGLRACLPSITNNDYYIRFITAPITWLRDVDQPVVVEGVYGAPHYVGAIGYAYNQWLFIKYDMRLFVTDNGYFTDKHYNYPFWSILGGLNYAWVNNN